MTRVPRSCTVKSKFLPHCSTHTYNIHTNVWIKSCYCALHTFQKQHLGENKQQQQNPLWIPLADNIVCTLTLKTEHLWVISVIFACLWASSIIGRVHFQVWVLCSVTVGQWSGGLLRAIPRSEFWWPEVSVRMLVQLSLISCHSVWFYLFFLSCDCTLVRNWLLSFVRLVLLGDQWALIISKSTALNSNPCVLYVHVATYVILKLLLKKQAKTS